MPGGAAGRAVHRFAAAKVNLALHVLGRRPDGYHELDTFAVFADVGDTITVSPADALTLAVSGPLAAHAPAGGDNLTLRAALLLKAHAGYPGGAELRLVKHLPAGAGLGGGSADAAATLAALNELWGLGLGYEQLARLGRELGADVPMCLHGRALRARGVGEKCEEVGGWPPLPLALVWPGRTVSTPAVFGALARRENPPLPDPRPAADPAELAEWLSACRNDLEAPALRLAPEIVGALQALRAAPGCLVARMTGSGSACFGIYRGLAEAEEAAAALRTARPDWWVAAATTR